MNLTALRNLFLFILLFFSLPIYAQQGKQDSIKKDSSKDASFYITTDSLLKKVEQLHTSLNRINNTSSHAFDTRTIETQLPEIQTNLSLINDALTNHAATLNSRNMQLFQVLLQDMQTQLDDWRNGLFDYNKELISMHTTMQHFKEDSNFLKQVRSDTLFRNLYKTELSGLKDKWKQASASMNENLARVNELQADVSNAYFQAMEIRNTIRKKLMQNSIGAFGKEYAYLWQFQNDTTQKVNENARAKAVAIQKRILNYYFKKIQDQWVWIWIIGAIFFIWIAKNFRTVRKNGQRELLATSGITHIKPWPVLSSLVLVFSIAPFFDLNPPVIYIQLIQFSLLIILTIKLRKTWSKTDFIYWLAILVLYFFFGFSNVATNASVTFRLILLLANVASVFFGISLLRVFKKAQYLQRFSAIAIIIYIILNAAAIFCNITGRLSIAKVLSSAAIFGATQLVALSVAIQIISEAFHLQMIASRITGGRNAVFNYEKIQKSLTRLLSTIAIISWSVILLANLNIYPIIYMMLNRLLNKPHEIGSINFTASHILLFFAILYISNLLQKYIGYFFGETEDDVAGQVNKKNSKLAIIRLLLLLGGFLLAIAASGLAIDKITVVLGALGVGIGLGLQTIVNNLVSGIILIFERPFQIGDSIQLSSDKKGKVKDMGIRSSRIVTEDGAEIIIPNGDLLSGSVTNWTLSNDHVRAVLTFKIQPVDKLDTAKESILEVLNANEYIMQRLPKEILLAGINDSSAEIKVLFWINNINSEQLAKSLILAAIYNALKQKEISIL